jgi:ABC-type nitrate/sulfonate/bicarbonate transport system permease component
VELRLGERIARDAASAALVIGAVLLWEVGVRVSGTPAFILPPPSAILTTLYADLPLLFHHAVATLAGVGLGLSLGVTAGILIALGMFYLPPLGRALHPLVVGSQMIPVFAVAPLLVLWFGYGIWPRAIVAALIAFFPISVNATDGLRAVSADLVDLLRSLGAREKHVFRHVRLPASLPFLFSGLKVAVTLGLTGATIGEWIGGRRGLGFLMIQSNAILRVDRVFAAIVVLALLGVALFFGVTLAERWLLRWRPAGAGAAKDG